MSMPRFQGDPDLSGKLNKLSAAIDSNSEIRGDENFVSVTKIPNGCTVSLNINQVLARIPKIYPSGLFPVRLQQSGGSAGTSTALCSYTYNVYQLDNSTQIGTAAAGVIGSPCRVVECACTHPATYGMAFYDAGGTLKIMFAADEGATQSNCS